MDAEAYTAASDQVMATLRAQPGATVQVLGWDEAFIGVHTEDPERYARQVQQAVLERGVSTHGGNWLEVMGDRPTIDPWAPASACLRTWMRAVWPWSKSVRNHRRG